MLSMLRLLLLLYTGACELAKYAALSESNPDEVSVSAPIQDVWVNGESSYIASPTGKVRGLSIR